MKLVLVTGAGASRNLALEGETMPLMRDWSNRLCDALDEREGGLASACHLQSDASGPEFEESLGLLLQFRQGHALARRFIDLGGPHPGSHTSPAEEALVATENRLHAVMDVLNTTLHDLFGLQRVDDRRATNAFRQLLEPLDNPELIVATTNYDRSAETALQGLSYRVSTGFPTRAGRTPILQPTSLVTHGMAHTPVIHLHGCVGWYERAGNVEDHYGDQPYRPEVGNPVVLYPDPNKDPMSNAIVSELWTEFRAALAWSDHVLVLGHSLHDPALVAELREVQGRTRVAVAYCEDDVRVRTVEQLPSAISLPYEFGPLPSSSQPDWREWTAT